MVRLLYHLKRDSKVLWPNWLNDDTTRCDEKHVSLGEHDRIDVGEAANSQGIEEPEDCPLVNRVDIWNQAFEAKVKKRKILGYPAVIGSVFWWQQSPGILAWDVLKNLCQALYLYAGLYGKITSHWHLYASVSTTLSTSHFPMTHQASHSKLLAEELADNGKWNHAAGKHACHSRHKIFFRCLHESYTYITWRACYWTHVV